MPILWDILPKWQPLLPASIPPTPPYFLLPCLDEDNRQVNKKWEMRTQNTGYSLSIILRVWYENFNVFFFFLDFRWTSSPWQWNAAAGSAQLGKRWSGGTVLAQTYGYGHQRGKRNKMETSLPGTFFQSIFLKKMHLYFDSNFTEVCS